MIILLTSFFIIFLSYLYNKEKLSWSNCEVFVFSILTLLSFIFFITEILSFYDIYKLLYLKTCYIALNSILIIYLFRKKAYLFLWTKIRDFDYSLLSKNYLFISFLVIFIFSIVFYSLTSAIYNQDSMAYHLPKVLNWVQNNSVKHFPANYLNQISLSPFSEYILLAIYVLSNYDDYYLNLLQGIMFLFNGYLIFSISNLLTNQVRYSLLSTFLWFSSPICYLEAFTTQNDLVACFFLLSYIYILTNFIIRNIFSYLSVLFLAIDTGLAFCTKQYVCLGILIISLCYLKETFRLLSLKQLIHSLIIFVVVFFIINIPERYRIYSTFGSFFPSETGSMLLVSTISPLLLFINFLKTICYNLCFNNITRDVGSFLFDFFENFFNIDKDNVNIAWLDHFFQYPSKYDYINHNVAPYTVLLYVVIAYFLIFLKKIIKEKKILTIQNKYVLAAVISFILISSIVRYTPSNVRFHISYLAILVTIIPIVLSKNIKKTVKKILFTSTAIIVVSSLCLNTVIYHKLWTETSPNREYSYYGNSFFAQGHILVIDYIKKHKNINNIGIYMPYGLYEYALKRTLLNYKSYKFYNIFVKNDSSKYEKNIKLDCLIYFDIKKSENILSYHGDMFTKKLEYHDKLQYYYVFINNKNEQSDF